jgi:UDPglucose 6-dehydrogenase
MMQVGFVGVGKLGQSCAEMIAEKHVVTGYDILPRSPHNFVMVNSIEDAVIGMDIIFIAVETPHDPSYDGSEPTSHLPNKDFDYSIVEYVIRQVNQFANSDQVVVLISTVLPGTTRERLSHLLTNADLIYNPYLIAMGTVKWDMVNPEMIMIGTKDGQKRGGADLLENLYSTIMENNPKIVLGTWEEIECLKVFYNTFISAKVSLVNMIQDVAQKLGNVNSELVCDALASSTRRIMGPAYMKPGMGDGGACHPRDNIALRYLASKLSLGYDLFDSVMKSREVQAENMAKFLISFGNPVIIVGKAYKPFVEYTNGSSSILVGFYVKKYGVDLHYHDEVIGEFAPNEGGPYTYLLAHSPEITYADQLDHVKDFLGAHLTLGGTAKPEHSSVVVNSANKSSLHFIPGSVVVDPWRKLPAIKDIQVIHYGNTRESCSS